MVITRLTQVINNVNAAIKIHNVMLKKHSILLEIIKRTNGYGKGS